MKKIVFFGGCDITAICKYIVRTPNVTIIDKNTTGCWNCLKSTYLVEAIKGTFNPDKTLFNIYYPDCEKLFSCDVLVLSLLNEIGDGLYKNSSNSCSAFFGYPHINAIKNPDYYYENKEQFDVSAIPILKSKYSFAGALTIENIINNYKIIISKIQKTTKVFILLGPTFDSVFGEKNDYFSVTDGKSLYSILNKKMKETFNQPNVVFIDPLSYYKKPKKIKELHYYNYPSIRHYPQSTYARIAIFLWFKNIRFLKLCPSLLKIFIKMLFKKRL